MFIESVYYIKDWGQNMFSHQKYKTENKKRDFNRTLSQSIFKSGKARQLSFLSNEHDSVINNIKICMKYET